MKKAARTILIVNDETDEVTELRTPLERAGYAVLEANSGTAALERVYVEPPSLIVLDLIMPGKTGADVCAELKGDNIYGHLPIILSVPEQALGGQINWETLKVDDYLVLPCSEKELLLRTTLCFSRASRDLDANPLTGLPGNNSLTEAITRAIEDGRELCVIYCDMDNFKAFNDKYGFARGDEAIRFAARIIMDSASALCGSGCFLGHIGGDDFAVIVPSARAESVAARIGQDFDLGILDLYDGRDREAGYLVSLGRKGEEQKFPLMHISMGGVHLGNHNFRHYLEVANMCAEVKKQAKLKPGSCVFFDRRKDM